jgi:hypothetical protein
MFRELFSRIKRKVLQAMVPIAYRCKYCGRHVAKHPPPYNLPKWDRWAKENAELECPLNPHTNKPVREPEHRRSYERVRPWETVSEMW